MPDEWRRYLAPAAFLLAATIAIVLVRSGLESGSNAGPGVTQTASTTPRKHVQVTTTTAKKRTTTSGTEKGFWTVEAGDTFGVISSKTGVPVATIEELNPDVKSTSLFIGQKIRIK